MRRYSAHRRIRLDPRDEWRAVLTDTSPFEVPIIYSTDGLYKLLRELPNRSDDFKTLINFLVCNPKRACTIPFRYNIVKDRNSFRTLSLLHPNAHFLIAQFYTSFWSLICAYGSRSRFSLRYPRKLGSQYYQPSARSDVNRYRQQTVDTLSIDTITRNPGSFFAYGGVNRLYKFFISDDFVKLEKKFSRMAAIDVSRCFDSIYTHSITWSIKGIDRAKQFRHAISFENSFDKLMQKINYQETNGICIGPEVSRIFAEVILSQIDNDIIDHTDGFSLQYGTDYECRRYVDNYYIFSNEKSIETRVEQAITLSLSQYKLGINPTKSTHSERPFYTEKSFITSLTGEIISRLFNSITEISYVHNHKFSYPTKIYRPKSLFRSFINDIKRCCFTANCRFDSVSNYIIGAFKNYTINLTDNYKYISHHENFEISNFRSMLIMFLDISFYFFTVHPTVASSLRISHQLVIAGNHLKKYDPDGYRIIRERILRWIVDLEISPIFISSERDQKTIPIEIWNVILAARGIDSSIVDMDILKQLDKRFGTGDYFDIIGKLFIMEGRNNFADLVVSVANSILARIKEGSWRQDRSDDVHLLMDVLANSKIPFDSRCQIIEEVWRFCQNKGENFRKLTSKDVEAIAKEFESTSCFVQWEDINILNMIEKKELSMVYS